MIDTRTEWHKASPHADQIIGYISREWRHTPEEVVANYDGHLIYEFLDAATEKDAFWLIDQMFSKSRRRRMMLMNSTMEE
jgi:hypothetical protein